MEDAAISANIRTTSDCEAGHMCPSLCINSIQAQVTYCKGSTAKLYGTISSNTLLSSKIMMFVWMVPGCVVNLLLIFTVSWWNYLEEEEQRRKNLHTSECIADGTWGNNLKYVKRIIKAAPASETSTYEGKSK